MQPADIYFRKHSDRKSFTLFFTHLLTLMIAAGLPGCAPAQPPAAPAAQPSSAQPAAAAPKRSAGFISAIKHFEKRTAQFAKDNEQRKMVVLLGDSITEGFDEKTLLPNRPVLNRGISSDTIGIEPVEKDPRGILHRLDVSVFDCNTTHVFMLIGVNDLGDGRQPKAMIGGIREIVEKIRERAPGVTIHLSTLLPTGGKYTKLNTGVVEFNEMLKPLAAELKCPLLDLHALYADEKGELPSISTRDGLHLLPSAYGPWKQEIEKAMGWNR